MVRHPGWQVEHVAGDELPGRGGFEVGEKAQVAVGDGAAVGALALVDRPAPRAARLQEEDVVLVDVRPDRGAVYGHSGPLR